MENLSPIFLVGASRSGTTLLRVMLNGHSQIHIPPEAWFLGELLDAFEPDVPFDEASLRKAHQIITDNVRWVDWNFSSQKLFEVLQACEGLLLRDLVDALFSKCSGLNEKKLWGEKSPRHSYYILKLRETFPEARFIHLIRDGRDSTASMLKRKWYDSDFRRIVTHWETTTRSALQGRKFGDSFYMELHFEDLIKSPESSLHTICQFLTLPFEKGMMNYRKQSESSVVRGETTLHDKLQNQLDHSEIGKWRNLLSLKEKIIFEIIAGETLRKAGYTSDSFKKQNPLLFSFLHLQLRLQSLLHQAREMLKNSLFGKILATKSS
ncbi:MAG: sulfotransferase family protein [Chthoniobacterales bacterium]